MARAMLLSYNTLIARTTQYYVYHSKIQRTPVVAVGSSYVQTLHMFRLFICSGSSYVQTLHMFMPFMCPDRFHAHRLHAHAFVLLYSCFHTLIFGLFLTA